VRVHVSPAVARGRRDRGEAARREWALSGVGGADARVRMRLVAVHGRRRRAGLARMNVARLVSVVSVARGTSLARVDVA
jgi:hypothetical protein